MTQISKSLPKRCGNEHLKTRRASSWARGKERKLARQKKQDQAHARNLELKAQGIPTPHEAKKIVARGKRFSRNISGVAIRKMAETSTAASFKLERS